MSPPEVINDGDDWPHSKIHTLCLRHIRKSANTTVEWRYTILDSVHPHIEGHIQFESNERPIVSCYINVKSWFVLSTSRVMGVNSSATIDVSVLDVQDWKWGNFKHNGRAEIESAVLTLIDGNQFSIEYETWYASMAPIQYALFWERKYPILDKLAD